LAASKIYQVFIIADSSYNRPVAGLISVNQLSAPPVIPFGYDSYRGIGYVATDSSSHFLKAYCAGSGNNGSRTLLFDLPQATAVTAGAATTYTAVDLSALVPTPNQNEYCRLVWIQSVFTPNAASDKLTLQSSTGTGATVVVNGQITTVPVYTYSLVPAVYSAGVMSINYKVSTASAAVAIDVAGFVF
jgi:hypothetical protein